MSSIKENLNCIRDNIKKYASGVNRDENDIILLAVTKTVDVNEVLEAINNGVTDVGENKPQELARKYEIIGNKVNWHLIGSLQTNKVKYIIDKVSMIHSLDRYALCEEIQKRAEKIDRTIDCLVQVNISKEDSKHGLYEENVIDFIKNVSSRYKNINIKESANNAKRSSEDITLIAVTKTVDVDKILEAIEYGVTDVGENKPQELARKYDIIGDKVKWHLIGSLQTNKVKYIIDKVHMIHSLDRESLCEEIQKRAEKIDRIIDCLVQVNISKEDSKHGLYEEDVIDFITNISNKYTNIRIKGLMTMAPFTENEDEVREVFRSLKNLSLDIDKLNIPNVSMKYLSMGMSNDYKIAVEEGSTIVRVGTSIFGERNYNNQ